MKFLKLLVFLFVRFINGATTQNYRQVTKSNISKISCSETRVSSLLHCTALSRKSKDVTFFFDNQNKQCRWNCRLQYNIVGVISDWQCYGLRICFSEHCFIGRRKIHDLHVATEACWGLLKGNSFIAFNHIVICIWKWLRLISKVCVKTQNTCIVLKRNNYCV